MRTAAVALTAVLLAAAYPAQANGRAQLLPAGQFKARDGRPGPGKSWTLTDAQGQALAAQINAVASRTPISIDYEHQTLLAAANGQPAPAAGWIEQVQWQPGEGLFAQVRWTARAQALIEADEYRYISPVILYQDDGTVVGLHNAALVSVPAIVGMDAVTAALAALATQRKTAPPFTRPTTPLETTRMELTVLAALLGLAATADAQGITAAITAMQAQLAARTTLPAALATALGVQATADEAAALAAVQRLRTPDSTTLATIAALQAQVTALSAAANTDKLSRLVDDAVAAKKLLPAMRDWALKQDMATLSAYLAVAPTYPGLDGQGDPKGLDGKAADGTDFAAIADKAVAYQTAQLAAGINVTTQQAVAAVMAAAAKA